MRPGTTEMDEISHVDNVGSMRAFLRVQTRKGSVVAETYSLPTSSMGEAELEEEKRRLTLRARTSFGPPPPAFEGWFVDAEDRFHVPRFYGLDRFGPAAVDGRVEGDAIDVAFEGALTDVQTRATRVVLERHLSSSGNGGAIVCLPCGYGKTVWAVHAIVALGRKACIFVHKSFLRDQWREAFEKFCPTARVGLIQGRRFDVEGCDVVIAMVMTMAKRQYDVTILDSFGTLCFDECHHMAAPIMNTATRCFRARYVIGLTATKDRPDGLTPLLHWCLGAEAFTVERDLETVRVSIALFSGGSREILSSEGKPLMSLMITRLATHNGRNAFIARRVCAFYEAGRVIIVLSDRIAQLHAIHKLLCSSMAEGDVGMFTGSTKETDRQTQLRRRVLLCSYGMANEGLDKREADTVVMATPKARVTQCIGRIQRPCTTKKTPLVLDVVDDVGVFEQLRWVRQRLYTKEQYEVQVLKAEATDDWYI